MTGDRVDCEHGLFSSSFGASETEIRLGKERELLGGDPGGGGGTSYKGLYGGGRLRPKGVPFQAVGI